MAEPIAITGLGVACALGGSTAEVSEALRAGVRPFAPVRRFDTGGFEVALGAEVPALDFEGRFGRAALRHTSRTDRLALWAAGDALAAAGLDARTREAAAVYVGASTGGMAELEAARASGGRVGLATYLGYPVWATALALGRVLGLRGPRATYVTACSSAAHALGLAMRRLRDGELEVAVAGGAESVSRLTLAGFGALGVLDPEGTRPFDAHRRGLTLGEGAAFFVLEPLGRAERRGAEVLAVLGGYGASADAHHVIHPRADGEGAVRAIRSALEDAGVAADEVDYVNAHGTGTTQNDAMEARAVRRVFGQRGLRVSSSKSMLGHTLGAAAALEAAATVLGMRDGFLPPNPGVTEAAPELEGLTLVRTAEARRPEVALSTSFAFGGNNAALVLLSPEASRRGAGRPPPRVRIDVVISGAAVACAGGTAAEPATVAALVGEAPGATAVPGEGVPPAPDVSGNGLAGLDPAAVLGKATVLHMDPLSAASAAACVLATRSARLGSTSELGIALGTSFGALDATLAFLGRLLARGAALVNPLEFPNLVHSAGAGHASMVLGATGANVTSTQEELAGDEAVAIMIERVARGELPAAVAGGGDLGSAALDAAYRAVDRVVGTRSSHAALVAALTLEPEDPCRRRGGMPWARVLGTGAAGPRDGAVGAVERALGAARAAGWHEERVDAWLRRSSEPLGAAHEERAASLPLLSHARALDVSAGLGDAGGAGAAAIAVGAALVAAGRARTVLVTAVTREGGARATLLGRSA